MLYTHKNTKSARIFDVDTQEAFSRVSEVSTSQGWIKVHRLPLRFDHKGNVISDKIRFRTIYAIQGREEKPCLFQCYGRITKQRVSDGD